jgi:hypothetical protein
LQQAGRSADRADMGMVAEISTLDPLMSSKSGKTAQSWKRAFLGLKYDSSRRICCLSSYKKHSKFRIKSST